MLFSYIGFVNAQSEEDSIDLDYSESLALKADADHNIVWEFKSSDEDVCITVLIMDEENGGKFEDEESFEADVESDGDETEDSGEYKIEDAGTYYIVFLNNDSSMQKTTVDYKVVFDQSTTGLPVILIYGIFFGIIAIIAAVVIIIIIIVVRKQNKKDRGLHTQQGIFYPQAGPQPYMNQPPAPMGAYYQQQFQQAPSPTVAPVPAGPSPNVDKFCPHCRAKILNPNATFCIECGANLKS